MKSIRKLVYFISVAALLLSADSPAFAAQSFQDWVNSIFPQTTKHHYVRTVFYTRPTVPPGPAPAGTHWMLMSWTQPMAGGRTEYEWVLDTSGNYLNDAAAVTARDFPDAAKYHIRIVGNNLYQTITQADINRWFVDRSKPGFEAHEYQVVRRPAGHHGHHGGRK